MMATLWRRALFLISGFLRCRRINGPHGETYLERYALARLPNGTALYLHRFLGDDPGEALHDHPWPWAVSWVLSGTLREIRRITNPPHAEDIRVHRAGRVYRLGGNDFHRIQLTTPEAWTLFGHGPKVGDWGFIDAAGGYQPHAVARQETPHRHWWRTAPRGHWQSRARLSPP